MRRLACALVVGAVLAVPGVAQAHTLTMGLALFKARQYVAALAARTFPTQEVGWQITGCARVSPHAVNCAFFTVSESDPVIQRRFRCDEAVQIYYATPRSHYRHTRPIGMPRCRRE
ncbi:MAG: hypothetical protein ACJ76S_13545 [Solirubrobacteraceae bacterium]|jgi:hypothetical protein